MEHEVLKLKPHHAWRAKPGCKVLVINQGELRLDYPEAWALSFESDCLKLRDRKPPDDRCTLAVSLMKLPDVDWSRVPLGVPLQTALESDARRPAEIGPVLTAARPDLELAWQELRFVDVCERRDAFSRVCLAREGRLQALLTLDFWPEDREWVVPVWEAVLASLELGQLIADPTLGPLVH